MPSSSLRIPVIAVLIAGAFAATASARPYPETIPLPNNWQPEGIATGFGNQFFAGSRATGGIFKGDLKSGRGAVLVPGQAGRAALGMKVDHRNRLFVAGGGTGKAFVYDARDGDLLREYTLTTATPTFVNDVVVTHKRAYFTDSHQKQLYVLDLGRRGRLPAASRTLPLKGDLQYDADPTTFELNGIDATFFGLRLITVQSRTGKLFVVNPRTGDTDEIVLENGDVAAGDGILLRGRTLYVVQNRLNRIAVIDLDRRLDEGEIEEHLVDDDFDVPTTIAAKGGFLWAVNARFTTPPGPDTTYDVVRVTP